MHLFCVSAVQVNLFISFLLFHSFRLFVFFIFYFISSPIIVVLGQSLSRPWTRFETRLPYSLSDVTSEPVNDFSLTKWRKCYSRRYTRISKKVGQHTIWLYVWTSCTIPGQVTGVFAFRIATTFKEYKRMASLVTNRSCWEGLWRGGGTMTEHVLQLYNKSIHCVCAHAQTYSRYITKKGERLVMCVIVVLLG